MSDRKPGMFIEMAAARRGRVKIEDQGCTAVGELAAVAVAGRAMP